MGFPCIVMEWVTGEKLSKGDLFSEKDGLEIVSQLADLLLKLHLVAPDIVPTDSLKADGVFIDQKAGGGFKVRLVDWGGYDEREGQIYEKSLIRFGEVMVDVFAPDLGFKVDRGQNAVPLSSLAAGLGKSRGVAEWDALTYGTRDLIRRVLQREGFQGSAQNILTSLLDACREQLKRWNEPNPLAKIREASGVDKLNWLDIAVARNEKALPVDTKGRPDDAGPVNGRVRAGRPAYDRLADAAHRQYGVRLRTCVSAGQHWRTRQPRGWRREANSPKRIAAGSSTILNTMEHGEDYSTARSALERAEAMLKKRPEAGEDALKAIQALLAQGAAAGQPAGCQHPSVG